METVVQPINLEGDHTRLVPLSFGHVAGLMEVVSGPRDTFGWTFVPDDEASLREYVATALKEQADGRSLPFATTDAKTGRILGTTRFANIEYFGWPKGSPHQRGAVNPDVVEIGWTWLAAEAQRTAINTEAKLLMLTHAFETWRVHRVCLCTDSRNTRSRNAIERIGGKLDGVVRAHRVSSVGDLRDTAWYSIIESEWPAAKAALNARLRP